MNNYADRTGSPAGSDSRSGRAKALFTRVAQAMRRREFAVRFWDGEIIPPQSGVPGRFVLDVCSPEAVRHVLERPDTLRFGEAYVHGLLDLEGSMIDALSQADALMDVPLSFKEKLAVAWQCRQLPKFRVPASGVFGGLKLSGTRDSRGRRALAINYHYNQPVEFWQLWLDASLAYSCAYFENAELSLADAQQAKLEFVCRKLRLKPGMRLLDMGCGWGALICHAARNYGVRGVGVTLSSRQAEQARARIAAQGLADRCEIRVADFRDMAEPEGFDAIASVGAVEHITEAEFAAYFRHVFGLLKPKGCFLNHGITRSLNVPPRSGDSFLDRYVFPDYWLATIGETVSAAEAAGFEVRDVENLRDHYTLTAGNWSRRFEAARPEIERLADALTFRVFRLYLAGVEFDFRCGRMNLGQTLMVKPENGVSGLPLTRRDWYERPMNP